MRKNVFDNGNESKIDSVFAWGGARRELQSKVKANGENKLE